MAIHEGASHALCETESLAPASNIRESTVARQHRLVTENYHFIWRLLRGFGMSADAADDAAQEVFLIASRRIDDVVPGSERAFLFGTARHIARDTRRRARLRRREDLVDSYVDPSPGPDALTDQKRAKELVDAVLDEMGEDLRAVLVLVEIEGFSAPEVAEVTEIPIGTVTSRLRRAREEFRARIKRERSILAPKRAAG